MSNEQGIAITLIWLAVVVAATVKRSTPAIALVGVIGTAAVMIWK